MEGKFAVEVHYYAKPGMRSAFYEAVRDAGIIAASQAEEGCLRYDYYFSPSNEDEICLLELWRSKADQEAHSKLPHFIALGGMKAQYIERTTLDTRYLPED